MNCWWDCISVQLLWKTLRCFLKKLKIEVLYSAAISLLNKDWQQGFKVIFKCMFITTLFSIDSKSKYPSMNKWTNKTWYISIHKMEHFIHIQPYKKGNSVSQHNMDLIFRALYEVNKPATKRQKRHGST